MMRCLLGFRNALLSAKLFFLCKTLSSTEAKNIAIVEARKEMIWMTDYLEELGKKQH